MVRKYASTLVILGMFVPRLAFALGLGELTLHSYLNEPLRAEIDLLETGGLDPDQIKIRLASREDFSRAGVERNYFLTSLKFSVGVNEKGEGYLAVSSHDPVREPFLDFLVEARWPNGRLLREYTVLLDPPIFAGDDTGIVSSVTVPAAAATPTETAGARPSTNERYGANATLTPEEGVAYMVQRDDTMWSIARRSRPTGTTIQQTMLDIQRMNPEAFIGNNINQLKAGYVLRLPTSSEISDTQFEEAVAEVAQQEQNWQDNVAAIDARQLNAPSGQASAGRPAGEEGRLQIAGVESETNSTGTEVSARMEDADRVERDNADLMARVDSMQEQVDTLKRLVTLKDDQISALQSALSGAGEQAPTSVLDQEEGTIDAIVEPLPDVTMPLETAPTDDVHAGEAPPYVPPAPAPDAGIMGLVMDYLLYIIGLVALLVTVVVWRFKDRLKLKLSLPAVGRRAKQDQSKGASDSDDEFAGVELVSDDSLIVDEFEDELIDDGGDADSLTSFSAPDEEAYAAQFETGDALAEADIYIAYGRFPQAVDLLKTAIHVEPINTEYRIKLMEACVEMVESGEFQQQYADLLVIADDPSLERARAMLDAVDGGEVWLDDLPAASITAEEVEAARAAAAAKPEPESEPEPEAAVDADDSEMEMPAHGLDSGDDAGFEAELDGGLDLELDDAALGDIDEEGLDLDLDLDADLDVAADMDLAADLDMAGFDLAEQAQESAEASDGSTEVDLDIEDDFDLGALSAAEPEDVPVEEDAGEIALEDDGDLDLSEFNIADFEADTAAQTEESVEDTDDELPELDLDDIATSLDSVALSESEAEPALEVASEADGGMLGDFGDLEIEIEIETEEDADLDLGELGESFGVEELDEVPAEQRSESEEPESFDLDELEAEEPAAQEPDTEEETAGEGLVFAADGDEIATKLDLARAYMDMGDHDGARSILEEVQADGSESQQQEAQTLLDSID